MTNSADTSKYSYYVDDEFYAETLLDMKKLEESFLSVSLETYQEIEQVLFQEARLIDELKLEEWLEMYSDKCLYWIPTVPGGGEPTREVSIAFDDRRRLEDRVYRIRTGYAYSQLPLSRTRHMLTNIEVTEGDSSEQIYVRTNFILYEFRVGKTRGFSGWIGYKLERENKEWKIKLKVVNLIDADQAHENLSFII